MTSSDLRRLYVLPTAPRQFAADLRHNVRGTHFAMRCAVRQLADG